MQGHGRAEPVYTDLDRSHIEVHEIPKLGRKCVDTNQLFIDGLRIPVEDRIGEENKGFAYILHGMNPERILIAAEAVGLGRAALARAALYAKERVVLTGRLARIRVFSTPLGTIVDGAGGRPPHGTKSRFSVRPRAALCRRSQCRQIFGGRGLGKACETAIFTHGGMGYPRNTM